MVCALSATGLQGWADTVVLVTPMETYQPGYGSVFPLLRAVTHRKKRGTAQRRRRKGG